MKKLDVVAAVLLVIGGLNWGLVGTAGIDVVATLFGPDVAVGARGLCARRPVGALPGHAVAGHSAAVAGTGARRAGVGRA